MKNRLTAYLVIAALTAAFLLTPDTAPAMDHAYKTFSTRYATVYFDNDNDMSDFVWRLSGERLDFAVNTFGVSHRIDRIIERVENILDMRPGHFKVDVFLKRGALKNGKIAYFEHKANAITLSVDTVTDGVFAHEVAHAVIYRNFGTLLPDKVQEILTQYVDKYLWGDY